MGSFAALEMEHMNGLNILVTRAQSQASGFSRLLELAGFNPLLFPCIEIVPVMPPENAEILQDLYNSEFGWLLFISKNAAEGFVENVHRWKSGIAKKTKVAAIGNKTAKVLKRLGIKVDLIPVDYTQNSLAAFIGSSEQFTDRPIILSGEKILLPVGNLNDGQLVAQLNAQNNPTTSMLVYKNTIGSGGISILASLQENMIDAITFCSPSAVHNFVERLLLVDGHLRMIAKVPIACLGPVTAQAASSAGFTVSIVAETHNGEGLIKGLKDFFA